MAYKNNTCSTYALKTSKTQTLLGAVTFFAKIHPSDVCGSNGLPLTPNSIAILGRSQRLKTFQNPNLCQYLDVVRGNHERIIIVSEYFGITLETLSSKVILNFTQVQRIFYQVACGINVLHKEHIAIHNIEPKNILLDSLGNTKLFNYGLFHMTKGGEYVPFPIGNIRYMAPEYFLGVRNNIKSDIWALGMIVAELVLQTTFWSHLKTSNISRKIISFCKSNNVLKKIAREHNKLDIYEKMDRKLHALLESCLNVVPSTRPLPHEIINHQLFVENLHLYITQMDKIYITPYEESQPILLQCPLDQIYHLWQLAGGDVQAELKKEGLIRSEAPILGLPQIVYLNGTSIGPYWHQSQLMDDRIVLLKLDALVERLSQLPMKAYFPLIHSSKFQYSFEKGMCQYPLVIREKDIEYQFHRVRLFSRLLVGYPSTYKLIQFEAAIDIPPLLRGPIWAALLHVLPNGSYAKIDKFTPTTTDRQIEVDIPRCHQYDELLSSPEGHHKLKRLLKAWITAHPQYVYWQGLDSLTAPFLYLNYNNEEIAYLSLYKFIPKYLQWFFLKDNSAIIKEYLCKFSQLLAFHEPVLAQHLSNINFIPELFAIPWFLTMFSHVFPLHKILHLWDKLMLGDHSYPLFIGIAILKQLKVTLLLSGFNECILLFSDLPDIVMENCVLESQNMYERAPKSLSERIYVSRQQQVTILDINPDDISLKQQQSEICPTLSAKDFHFMLQYKPHELAIIDLRSIVDYGRVRVDNSINIPFASIQFGEQRLDALNVPHLEARLHDRIVVCVSNIHENAVEFSRFLIACGIVRVCVLHKGFNILHKIEPNILVSN